MLKSWLGPLLAVLVLVAPGLRAELLSHWTMDGHFEDDGPGGNEGIWQGPLEPLFTDGYDGTEEGAIELNGLDEFILVEQNAGLPLYGNPEFTVAMWVRGDIQNDRRIWSESSNENNSSLFNLGTQNQGADGRFDLFVRDAGGATFGTHAYSNGEPFDAEWHHVAWVDEAGTATLYIDGEADGRIFDYGRPDLGANLDITTIGGILRQTSCCHFTGAIDDVRIFDHALSGEEVVQTFAGDIDCPAEGDTNCEGLTVEGPDGDLTGQWQITAQATDDSGDDISYRFELIGPDGQVLSAGPQADPSATFSLLVAGEWNVTVTVDDDPLCFDVGVECGTEIEVLTPPEELVAHLTFDGDTEDSTDNANDGIPFTNIDPIYVDGFDGTEEGAAEFNGFDDLIVLEQNVGLPLYNAPNFSVAMWVKGLPQQDMRVFSMGSTADNNPLFNIGTHNQAADGTVDLYIRGGGGVPLNHVHSTREAFDGSWHHIAWVDEGGNAVLYVDGVLDETSFTYVKPDLALDTTTVGGILRANPSHWFTGSIDEVRLYNYALTPEEVVDLVGEFECPDEGDTHCDDIDAEGPEGDVAGAWTFTAFDAVDDSGDTITYSWRATRAGDGAEQISAPSVDNFVVFQLGGGEWTVEVTVDDGALCEDQADDAICSIEVEVLVDEGEFLSHWPFEGDLVDVENAGNDGVMTEGDAVFVDGVVGDAIAFDGLGFVSAQHNDGLPLYANANFSISMWVRGLPQNDRRVWSESSSLNNTPLFNLGTESTGATGQVDLFVRGPDGTNTGHVLSDGIAFDGEWHHIAWTDELGQAALYIDGVRDTADLSYVRPAMELDITTIGGIFRAGPCCQFTGDIDEVKVYTYILSEEEIEELANPDGVDPEDPVLVRGDADASGALNITDGIFILNFLFLGGPGPDCEDGGDADDSGGINITDGIFILNFLFLGGDAPPAPYPDCGEDTTDDELSCPADQASCA